MIDTFKSTIQDPYLTSKECLSNSEIAWECTDYKDSRIWAVLAHIITRLEKLEDAR